MKKLIIIFALMFSFCLNNTNAQSTKITEKESVATLDNIISTLYETVSGVKGEERNWNLLKRLCHKDAKLIYYAINEKGENELTYLTVDDYINLVGEYFKNNNFFEREIHRKVDSFGPITHIFSTYESLKNESDDKPFARGINSIQLLNDGERWWIINIYWVSESKENPIPAEYLPAN